MPNAEATRPAASHHRSAFAIAWDTDGQASTRAMTQSITAAIATAMPTHPDDQRQPSPGPGGAGGGLLVEVGHHLVGSDRGRGVRSVAAANAASSRRTRSAPSPATPWRRRDRPPPHRSSRHRGDVVELVVDEDLSGCPGKGEGVLALGGQSELVGQLGEHDVVDSSATWVGSKRKPRSCGVISTIRPPAATIGRYVPQHGKALVRREVLDQMSGEDRVERSPARHSSGSAKNSSTVYASHPRSRAALTRCSLWSTPTEPGRQVRQVAAVAAPDVQGAAEPHPSEVRPVRRLDVERPSSTTCSAAGSAAPRMPRRRWPHRRHRCPAGADDLDLARPRPAPAWSDRSCQGRDRATGRHDVVARRSGRQLPSAIAPASSSLRT